MVDRSESSRTTASRYDALSAWYRLAARSEAPLHRRALEVLAPRAGEHLLEIGPGTGEVLVQMAAEVGAEGTATGLDVSPGMLRETRRHAGVCGVRDRVRCILADGARIAFDDQTFDGVLMSFALERFPSTEIPSVLSECSRVLKPGGRLVVAALADRAPRPAAVNVYLWAHRTFPRWIDCRPIDVASLVEASGLLVDEVAAFGLWGLPVDIVRAQRRVAPPPDCLPASADPRDVGPPVQLVLI